MDKDFNELIEYLDKKFQDTVKKEDLDRLTIKLVTLDEFDQFKSEIKEEFSSLKELIQSLTIAVDRLVKAVSDLKIEYTAIINQISRHERWIQKLADKLRVKLEY